jgi:predicted RNA binding protein YcfA (HicA-like mRNA interferase family)
MRYSGIKFRDVERILKRNGYTREKAKGSHVKFRKGIDSLVITNASSGVNQMLWRRLVKEHKISIDT